MVVWKREGKGEPLWSWQQNLPMNQAQEGILLETAVSMGFFSDEQVLSPSFSKSNRGWIRNAVEEPFVRRRSRCLFHQPSLSAQLLSIEVLTTSILR